MGCPAGLQSSCPEAKLSSTTSDDALQEHPKDLWLHNTMSGRKELFQPRPGQGNKVSMYCCGVTVYDYSHVGHARVYCAFDVLFRYLRHLGYEVDYVRNFTDIDDKIIKRASETGEDPLQLSQRFIHEFHTDMDALNCLAPTSEPKATDFISQMVDMIGRIVKAGHGYEADGSVWFSVESVPGYGRLSGRSLDDNRAGERVAVNTTKRNPADFVLWKAAKVGEPKWDSPWGPGRPGWHIECSAMIRELMGPIIDIHGGGRDLIHPHHDNELVQSQAAACECDRENMLDHRDFVRWWMHLGFVNVDSEKMSKSLGNFFTIRDVLQMYHPMALRWFLINTQYRQAINYTERSLQEASDRLYYIYQTLQDAEAALTAAAAAGEQVSVATEQHSNGTKLLKSVEASLCDDLNTPQAFAALSEPLKTMNDLLHTKKGKKAGGRLQTIATLQQALNSVLELLGLGAGDIGAVLVEMRQRALHRAGLKEQDVELSIERRAVARAAKDYASADKERAFLAERGIMIMDGSEGTLWRPGIPDSQSN
ncbi:tRNA synthetase class I (C) family protein [Coccomyxa subellipsoidea C-169]|uniref:cysteine--tRNA ligase n=1 Tax=Coccomyxa subellipsoidea (strain C-169) TaxID=574566 RepID=I0Z3S3_COCSC|nr:tRNA synthetase class I (C) family protein [Coccomyxa subellipsoidea C-169]EIE25292.1 tRNA synthetase class I (C) family protein [Coccomyxa subellipsoidea C-169]|eukprot:XP_005649836.1 tRNA synthetase class I (C) family protein [Coccomyxa subellipsoidea C-169]